MRFCVYAQNTDNFLFNKYFRLKTSTWLLTIEFLLYDIEVNKK